MINKFYQGWITHKARKIILILNQIAVLTHPYILYSCLRLGLWPEHAFCQGQMIHKPRKRELSILLTEHCLDKIHISDGRTDKHDVYRTITFNRSCNVLKVNPSGKKQQTVPNICQNRRPYRAQTLFQFSASPALILGTTENATFAHLMKKSMHLKTGFLSAYQVLFLLLNGPQIETSL